VVLHERYQEEWAASGHCNTGQLVADRILPTDSIVNHDDVAGSLASDDPGQDPPGVSNPAIASKMSFPNGVDVEGANSAAGQILLWPFRLIRDYPRACISGILTVLSAAIGIYLLPTQEVLATNAADIRYVGVATDPPVPTYLGFVARGDRTAQVVVAFQIPADMPPVNWEIILQPSQSDHIRWRNASDPGYRALNSGQTIGGQVTGPTSNYQELQQGYWSFSASSKILLSGKPIPDLVSIMVRTTGPDQFRLVSGYDMSSNLPALVDPEPSMPFTSEDLVDAPGFENLTGGPQIQHGAWWSWLTTGTTAQTSATGVNEAARQVSENRGFYAAVAFGVSGAALAAFAIELVGALWEEDRSMGKIRRPRHFTSTAPGR